MLMIWVNYNSKVPYWGREGANTCKHLKHTWNKQASEYSCCLAVILARQQLVLVPWLICSCCSGLQHAEQLSKEASLWPSNGTHLFALLCMRVKLHWTKTKTLARYHERQHSSQTDARRVMSTVCVVLCCVHAVVSAHDPTTWLSAMWLSLYDFQNLF